MSETPNNTDQTDTTPGSAPQVTPEKVTLHPNHPYIKKMVNDAVDSKLIGLEDLITTAVDLHKLKESNPKLSDIGRSNMSDDTISKDWVERKHAELDNKIEMEKVRNDAKFERLFSELKSEYEKNTLRMEASFSQIETKIAQSESHLTKWIMAVIFAILGLGFAALRYSPSSPAHVTYEQPPSSVSQSAGRPQESKPQTP